MFHIFNTNPELLVLMFQKYSHLKQCYEVPKNVFVHTIIGQSACAYVCVCVVTKST